ncbi:MAG: hypothetical protein MR588_08370 [Bacteroidales bacterium]|nr:hypothetical protein [Bacteroidales bacterium]
MALCPRLRPPRHSAGGTILSCRDGRCRRAILYRHDDYAASIRKSGPEIKNHCTQEGVNRQNPAVIPKFTP